MNDADYRFLSEFLLERSGLTLSEGKQYLIDARLQPLAQSVGLQEISQLVSALRERRDPQLEIAVTEAMTTNETSFFRDKTPFEELEKTLLPRVTANRQHEQKLRIWCAAASTGQEPYTIAMVLYDAFPQLHSWQVEILATDLSNEVLRTAEAGVYSQFEVQRGLPITALVKHFDQDGPNWTIKPHLRQWITFRQLNLLNNFSHYGEFDIVFCRNVLIYFDVDTKRDVLERIHRLTRNDGYLLLGAAETVMGVTDRFQKLNGCRAGVYTPTSALHQHV